MASKQNPVTVRAQARQRTLGALARRRQRDELNATRLEEFFTAAEREAAIDHDTEREIAAVREKAAARKHALTDTKHAALAGIHSNGETASTIAQWTGLPAKDIRALLHHTSAPAATPAAHDPAITGAD
ncbi:hypothetical protein [Hoyosella subflava]|uniref:hypothetical protein n=1 Tax=Hoyosella subflava TaxID=639313 RepID=UPI0011D2A780|nr:hypothetical protein [Hoyosella subflava]